MGGLAAKISRRRILGAAAGSVGAAVLSRRAALAAPKTDQRGLNHLAWVWQFEDDGAPELIRWVLARNGLGIILKTHDGTDWMARWDESRTAIQGPESVRGWSNFFEAMGVPFHAWAVVEGHDPITEARMAAEVLSSGARSLTIDLEPGEGRNYWQAGPQEAIAFGRELRRLQPNAWLSVAPDPRPWQLEEVPMGEFASFTNEIAPQTYWETFNSYANHRLLEERGVELGPDGVTPELMLNVTQAALRRFRLPLRPVGQGKADRGAWLRFVRHAYGLGMDSVSVWRFGTSSPEVWQLLQEMHPGNQTIAVPQRSGAYYSIPSSTAGQSTAVTVQTLAETSSMSQQGAASQADDKKAPVKSILSEAAAPEGTSSKPAWRWFAGNAGQ